MNKFLDGVEIEVPCPKCKRKTKKSVGWIKANRSFACTCGTLVNLQSEQLKQVVRKIEDDIDRLGGN